MTHNIAMYTVEFFFFCFLFLLVFSSNHDFLSFTRKCNYNHYLDKVQEFKTSESQKGNEKQNFVKYQEEIQGRCSRQGMSKESLKSSKQQKQRKQKESSSSKMMPIITRSNKVSPSQGSISPQTRYSCLSTAYKVRFKDTGSCDIFCIV